MGAKKKPQPQTSPLRLSPDVRDAAERLRDHVQRYGWESIYIPKIAIRDDSDDASGFGATLATGPATMGRVIEYALLAFMRERGIK